MANFFRDNEDIQFLLEHIDLGELAGVQKRVFADAKARVDHAATAKANATDNRLRWAADVRCRRTLDSR